ncbi:SRPBCC family protein [Aquimarina pacifica]|uniref:SRPBCC family protein n=1 Tax=Aquimarina pacifica TaxID=1296415 RepID=UPI0004705F6D|nr:SRPBCC family protein [Aquimarina pacifica]
METPINIAKAEMLIRKPVKDVFNAFTNPDITTQFWFTHSSGKLEEGMRVIWSWKMYNLHVPVDVKKIIPNEQIIIEWGKEKHRSTVKWQFKSLASQKTFVTITNYDFKGIGNELVSQVVDSTGGFTLVIAGAKAWLEHSIQLNLIGDKFPKELMDGLK